jgi:alpha-tubulin suppressor-like RCC1 family protein
MAVNVSAGVNNIKIAWTNPATPRLIYPSDLGQYVIGNQTYLMPLEAGDQWIYDNNQKVVQFAVGRSHSAILLSDGSIMTCGNNQYGQLANSYLLGSTVGGQDEFKSIGGTNYLRVACGQHHTILLLNTGRILSCGLNNFGQLGIAQNGGTNNANIVPQFISGITNAISIACGGFHTAILLGTGEIMTCGNNQYGQLGYSLNSGTTSVNNTPQIVPDISNAIAISCGLYFTAVLLSDGTIRTFGLNQRGQLGVSTNSGTTTAIFQLQIPNVTNIIQIECGNEHMACLDNSGNVYTCGINLYGNLGYSTNSGSVNANNTLTRVSSLSTTKSIGIGSYHTAAVDLSGNVRMFGLNQFGQLATATNVGNAGANSTPLLADISNIIQVKGGSNHTMFLTASGHLYTVGSNQVGQTARGKSIIQYVEDYISDNDISSVSTGFGAQHSAIVSGNTLKTFGFNSNGQLGIKVSNSNIYSVPQTVDLSNVRLIAMGDAFSIVVKTDGSLASFGYNFSGQTGNINTFQTTTGGNIPYNIPNITNVAGISCGSDHTAIRLTNGNIRTFGSNSKGQLGVSTIATSTYLPQDVSGLTNVRKVVCGRSFTIAVLNDGTVRSFGLNNFGQLGHSLTLNLSTGTNIPTLIPDITTAVDAACGVDHACILLQNGQIMTFGNNRYGQLGRSINTGTSVSNFLPTLVPNISNVASISCGNCLTACETLSRTSFAAASKLELKLNSTVMMLEPWLEEADIERIPSTPFITFSKGSVICD